MISSATSGGIYGTTQTTALNNNNNTNHLLNTREVTGHEKKSPKKNGWERLADQISVFVKTLGESTWDGTIKNEKGYFKGRLVHGKPKGEIIIEVRGGFLTAIFEDGFYSNGNGSLQLSKSDIKYTGGIRDLVILYTGGIRGLVPQGNGSEVLETRSTFEGNYENGKKEGHGRSDSLDCGKDHYEGEWKNDKREGTGCVWYDSKSIHAMRVWKPVHYQVMNLKDGIYYGEWKNDRWDGFGILSFEDGSGYEGGWKDGWMDGQGTRKWSDGTCYEGYWEEGNPHGHGLYIGPDGSKYEGEWVKGYRAENDECS